MLRCKYFKFYQFGVPVQVKSAVLGTRSALDAFADHFSGATFSYHWLIDQLHIVDKDVVELPATVSISSPCLPKRS